MQGKTATGKAVLEHAQILGKPQRQARPVRHNHQEADEAVLARVHEPLSVLDALEVGRAMHSWSLDASLARVASEGKGVVVFLNCGENSAQLLAQFDGTARASHGPERGRMDLRTYGVGAQILRECGVRKMKLMGTPRRMPSMTGYGLEIVGYVAP